MAFTIDLGAPFGLYVSPPRWTHGEEKLWFHVARRVDPALLDELLAARRSAPRLRRFLVERGAPCWRSALEERVEVAPGELDERRARLAELVPQRAASLRDLEAGSVPARAWRKVLTGLERMEQLLAHDAPPILVGLERARLEYLAGALAAPERAGYAAHFDSLRDAVVDAALLLGALGDCEAGLGDEAHDLPAPGRRQLVPATRARLPAPDGDRLAVVRGAEIPAYVERLEGLLAELARDPDNWEAARDRVERLLDALRTEEGSWLVGLARWRFSLTCGGQQPFPAEGDR